MHSNSSSADQTALSDGSTSVLVLVAKWPQSGRSKTRLVKGLASAAAACASPGSTSERLLAEAQSQAAAFSYAATADLVECLAGLEQCERVLLYAPPVDEAAQYFSSLINEAGGGGTWTLMPVLATSSAGGSNLGAILADATHRVRATFGVGRLAFIGTDCPELPLAEVRAALARAGDPRGSVAAICPAADGGYTLLALPADADADACFADVAWSQSTTCLSQLAALTRAGLLCTVGATYGDVDEVEDLHALADRLLGLPQSPRISTNGERGHQRVKQSPEATGEADGGHAGVGSALVAGGAASGGSRGCPRTAAFLAQLQH